MEAVGSLIRPLVLSQLRILRRRQSQVTSSPPVFNPVFQHLPSLRQSGDSIPIHQGSGICLHRKAVAIPVGEQPNLLQYVSCHRIRPLQRMLYAHAR
jgi:hypothetical protein